MTPTVSRRFTPPHDQLPVHPDGFTIQDPRDHLNIEPWQMEHPPWDYSLRWCMYRNGWVNFSTPKAERQSFPKRKRVVQPRSDEPDLNLDLFGGRRR